MNRQSTDAGINANEFVEAITAPGANPGVVHVLRSGPGLGRNRSLEEAAAVSAAFTLSMRSMSADPAVKALVRAEALARLLLAAAIKDMDEAPAPALAEQARVETAKDAHAQALANLVRGQRS